MQLRQYKLEHRINDYLVEELTTWLPDGSVKVRDRVMLDGDSTMWSVTYRFSLVWLAEDVSKLPHRPFMVLPRVD